MKPRSGGIFFILVGSFNCLGLASVVTGPTNQTTCYGTTSFFNCVINDSATITWLINGQGLNGQGGVTVPATIPLSPGVKSTLILPGSSLFSGASVVCSYVSGQIFIYSLPAFLTILGPTSLPNLISIPHNTTSTSLTWLFEPAMSSALNYQVEIRNSIGLLVFNKTLSSSQLVYTFPDPCDRYDAAVTAMYGYPNLTCTQRGFVQLAGVYPSTPLILPKRFVECSLSAQGLFNVNISVSPQQGVCSYNISWTSSGSQPISYPAQKPIVSNVNQLIFNVSLPFNLLVNLTVKASNSYGSNSLSKIYSTSEILDVAINATSLPGSWRAVCTFISCSQSIGCLVVLNDTYCTASNRYANSLLIITCRMPYNDSLPGPGIYSVKAYAVLSNGSYVDSLYTGLTELKNEGTPTIATMSQQADISAVVGAVIGILIIVIIIITITIIIMKYRNLKYRRSTVIEMNIEMQNEGVPSTMVTAVAADRREAASAEDEHVVKDIPHVAPSNTETGDSGVEQVRGETALMKASSEGHVERVLLLLQSGADVDLPNENGLTELMKASSEGHDDVVQLLLDKGAKVDLKDGGEETALMKASYEGHDKCVELLLEKGAKVDHTDEIKWTALMKASREGHVKCVELLLNKGAQINFQSTKGLTALMIASEGQSEGHFECEKLLLEKGAEVNHSDGRGETPLMKASSVEFAKLLLDWDAKINHMDWGGETALMKASSGGLVECVKLLLDQGADVNVKDKSGETALMKASSRGHAECVILLLGKDAKVDLHHEKGLTALMMASREGHNECVERLLDKGALVDLQDERGVTALMLASLKGHEECVTLLLDKDADINIQKKKGLTALMLASYYGYKECVELLLDKGAKVDHQDQSGETALMLASLEVHKECVTLLLDKGADINIQKTSGETALMLASIKGHEECVTLLLDKGADIHIQNKMGRTALMLASLKRHKECVKFLLDKGAKFDHQDELGGTALMLACNEGHLECVTLLLDKGADINIQNKSGETALQMASSGEHDECVQLLFNKGAMIKLYDEVR